MAIKIIDQPDIHMTASEHQRLLAEYQRAFSFYAGTPPAFEDWVRSRSLKEGTLLNEAI